LSRRVPGLKLSRAVALGPDTPVERCRNPSHQLDWESSKFRVSKPAFNMDFVRSTNVQVSIVYSCNKSNIDEGALKRAQSN
jgi:hypothetical protein